MCPTLLCTLSTRVEESTMWKRSQFRTMAKLVMLPSGASNDTSSEWFFALEGPPWECTGID